MKVEKLVGLNIFLTLAVLAAMVYVALQANTAWKAIQAKAASFGVTL